MPTLRNRNREPIAPKKGAEDLSNIEIVTLAVFLLNGDSTYVDTEDIAVRASKLAPGRFAWRKYPNQINLEIVRVYLSDAKKTDKGMFLVGSGKLGWMLTEKGLRFARKAAPDLGGIDLARTPLSPRDQQLRRRERGRLLASDSYAKFSTENPHEMTTKDAEILFRLDDYVVGNARERKIIRLMNMFAEDPDLGPVLQAAAQALRKAV